MRQYWRAPLFVIVIMLLVAACQQAGEDPRPTPDQSSIAAASTLFAQPTRVIDSTPTPLPGNDVEIALNRTVARMEAAVLERDFETYMAHVVQDDPVFLANHIQWAQDWVAHPLDFFQIDLFNIQSYQPGMAETRMTLQWRVAGRQDEGSAGGATISVIFEQDGDRWLLAGPAWQVVELDSITFYYFATDAVNITPQATIVRDYLPSIYTGVTVEFDYVPEHIAHIQLFESPITLQNWTRISMPGITRWNVPGEAIKLPLTQNGTAPNEPAVGRELTRFLLYEMAGGPLDNFPWWLETGIVEYGGARFSTLSQRNRVLRSVAALSLAPESAEEQLFDWAMLAQEPDVLDEFKRVAANQAYTLIHYITETHGQAARNAWIQAAAGGEDLETATQAHLGVTLEALYAAWRAWLPSQL